MLLNDAHVLALHDVGEPVLRLARDRCDECSVVHDVPADACIVGEMCVSRRDPQTVAEVTLRSRRDFHSVNKSTATSSP